MTYHNKSDFFLKHMNLETELANFFSPGSLKENRTSFAEV
jgi:hypothetical protein